MKSIKMLLAAVSLALASVSANAAVTIDFHSTRSIANFSNNIEDGSSSTGIPKSELLHAVDVSNESTTDIEWLANAGQTILYWDMGHLISQTDTFLGTIFSVGFTVDTNSSYSLSGYYFVTDASDHGQVQQDVRLSTQAGDNIFESLQSSVNTPNEHYTLGMIDGEIPGSFVSGSMTGTLIHGQSYYFSSDAFVGAFGGNVNSSAVGNVTLIITELPEPASAILCAACALLGAFYRVR